MHCRRTAARLGSTNPNPNPNPNPSPHPHPNPNPNPHQADSSEAGQYYAKVMAKIEKAPDFVSKEVARLTKMKVSKSAVSQPVSSK